LRLRGRGALSLRL